MACFESGGKEQGHKKAKWPLEAENANQKGKSNPVLWPQGTEFCQLLERAQKEITVLWPPEKRTLLLTPSFQPCEAQSREPAEPGCAPLK